MGKRKVSFREPGISTTCLLTQTSGPESWEQCKCVGTSVFKQMPVLLAPSQALPSLSTEPVRPQVSLISCEDVHTRLEFVCSSAVDILMWLVSVHPECLRNWEC